jgi:hypothetical protein
MSGREFEPVSAWRRRPKHFCVGCGAKANSHVAGVGFTCVDHYEDVMNSMLDQHGEAYGRTALRYSWRSEFEFLKFWLTKSWGADFERSKP